MIKLIYFLIDEMRKIFLVNSLKKYIFHLFFKIIHTKICMKPNSGFIQNLYETKPDANVWCDLSVN